MGKKKLRLNIDEKNTRDTKAIRFSEAEENKIQRAANRYCNGNFSEYVRYATLHFVPSEDDLMEGSA